MTDYHELVDRLEEFLLGSEPDRSGQQLADDVGIPFEEARQRWRSLGLTEVEPDVVAFTERDEEALRLTQRLRELGFVDERDEQALVRSMGRSFARLADWQMRMLARSVDVETTDPEEIGAMFAELVPAIESLQSYVWRRHVLAVGARLMLAAEQREERDETEHEGDQEAGDQEAGDQQPVTGRDVAESTGVGFADIVNYTKTSRSLSSGELTDLIDGFEARALDIVTAHGGRIVKTIGDEVLFVADRPEELARIGLELVEERDEQTDFPELRVGLAWGPVVARLGDVLGPVVNVASRLTSTARPGRVLVDKCLAEELEADESLRLRRLRRTSVRGYRKLEPWLLRGSHDERDDVEGPASAFLADRRDDLRHLMDEVDLRGERTSGGEGDDERPDG